jgi:hypothetical protein
MPEINDSLFSELKDGFVRKMNDDCWIQEIDYLIQQIKTPRLRNNL